MVYTIHHRTTYTYFDPVSLGHNVIKLLPRKTGEQTCHKTMVRIFPEPDTQDEYEDFYGNRVLYFSIEKEHSALVLDVISEIEKKPTAGSQINLFSTASLEEVKADLLDLKPGHNGIRQFTYETPMTVWNDEIKTYAANSFLPGRPVFESCVDLMHRIYLDFKFSPGFTTIATPISEVMKQRKGVCQDFAQLAIACVRSVGLAARYVSGYIETVSAAGTEKLVGVDASHAWFSVYISNMGWVDFDPTNDIIANDQHITIGWGRDYDDVSPFKGIIQSSGQHELMVAVDVRRQFNSTIGY